MSLFEEEWYYEKIVFIYLMIRSGTVQIRIFYSEVDAQLKSTVTVTRRVTRTRNSNAVGKALNFRIVVEINRLGSRPKRMYNRKHFRFSVRSTRKK